MNYLISPEPDETHAGSNVDQAKLEQLMRARQAEQSLPLALAAGLLSSIIAAAVWAAISYATGYQIGFMAIGVGFLVGYAVNYFGKGMTSTYGVIGAVFALLGCLFGNLLTSFVVLSQLEDSPTLAVFLAFLTAPGLVFEIMKETFSPIDLLFYGLAIFQGFKLSFGGLTEEEIASVQKQTEPAAPAAAE